MKLFLRFCFLVGLVTGFCVAVQAANKNVGVGIILGAPTGFSFKADLDSVNSIDAALAWSESISVHVHADYLWNKPKLFFLDNYPIDAYYGIGARLRERDSKHFSGDEDGVQLGLRLPAGLSFLFHDPKVELFTELAFIMNVVPETDLDVDLGIGARYYF